MQLATILAACALVCPGGLFAQSARLQGVVQDAKTQKPVPAALLTAVAAAPPAIARTTKSGGDGTFQFQGLPPGKYSLCVQAGDQFLDPCRWNGNPVTVTLAAAQSTAGITVRLTAASLLSIQVRDDLQILSQKTKDGRRPDLTLGVIGPRGLYYPAHLSNAPLPNLMPGKSLNGSTYTYQLAVPRDTGLALHIASHDLKLGDAAGAALPANASQQAFQHATGDPSPKSFVFSVLAQLP